MRIVIIGAGGFSAEVADMLRTLGHTVIGYFDENLAVQAGYGEDSPPVVNSLEDLPSDSVAAWAIGDGVARKRLWRSVSDRFEMPLFAHPSACVSPAASLGRGTLVMQNVVVSANARVGDCSILNVACYVAHDCTVGDFVHLASGVQMGGGSSVGEGGMCGTNSTLLPYTTIGEWSTCGAGAVVNKDIPPRSIAVGVPARTIGVPRDTEVEAISADE